MFKKKRKMRRNVFLERRERRARNRIFRILFIILGMLLIYFILSSPLLKIKKINVSGNNSIPLEKIEGEIKLILEENIWLLIPGDNIIFASAKNSEEKIKEKFSEVKGVKIRKNWLDIKNPGEFKLEVEILEKEKNVIWCRECPFDENNNNDCFYLDEEGAAFGAAEREADKMREIIIFEKPQRNKISINKETSEGELFVENKSDEKMSEWKIDCGECGDDNCFKEKEIADGEENASCYLLPEICLNPISIGGQAADKQFISFVLDLDKKLKQNNRFKIEKYQTSGVKTREIIAHTDKGLKIYFSALEGVDNQMGYLKDFLTKGIDKSELDNLEYIYLEAGNRIFYK